MVAVRWTGFFGSSLGKLEMFQLRLFENHDLEDRPLDFTTVSGCSLPGQEGKRACAQKSVYVYLNDFFVGVNLPCRGASNLR